MGLGEFDRKGANDIGTQRKILDLVHLSQLDTFENTGILAKVKKSVGVNDDKLFGQPMASMVKKKTRGREVITQFSIAVAKTDENNSRTTTYVPVAEELSGAISPVGDFTNKDAKVVFNMLNGLQESKETGILPNLDPNYLNISDPRRRLSRRSKP